MAFPGWQKKAVFDPDPAVQEIYWLCETHFKHHRLVKFLSIPLSELLSCCFCCCSLRTRTTWITLNGMLSYLRRSQHGHLPPNLPFMWMFPTWHLLQSTWPAVAIRNCSLALENKAVNFPITKVRLKWVCVGVCLCVWTNVLSCHFERNIKGERL